MLYALALWLAVRNRHQPEEGGPARWSLRRSLFLLGLGTAATALVAETITGSIGAFADALHVSEFFVAAVIVAIAGNAAEHGAAVVVAVRGELKLATDIALESAAQVAALVIPLIALASWLFEPLPLAFRTVEIVALAGAVLLASALLVRGRATRAAGAALTLAYAVVAVAFVLD